MKFKLNCGRKELVLMMCLSLFLAIPLFAQQENEEEEIPPPPLALSGEEHNKLIEAKGIKDRTQLSVQFAETHLQKAEKLTEEAQFDDALNEISDYNAVVQNVMNFLRLNNINDNGKVRDNYRRLETALRLEVPRLEAIRRTTPATYAVHVKRTLDYVRDARTTALESFFSDTVLRGEPAKATNAFTDKSAEIKKPSPSALTTEKKPE